MKKILYSLFLLVFLVGCQEISSSKLETSSTTDSITSISTAFSTAITTTEEVVSTTTTTEKVVSTTTTSEIIETTEGEEQSQLIEAWSNLYSEIVGQVNPVFIDDSVTKLSNPFNEAYLPYGFDNPPSVPNTYDKENVYPTKSGFYGRLMENTELLFGNYGLLAKIENKLFEDNDQVSVEYLENAYHIFSDNFEMFLEDTDSISFEYLEVKQTSFDDDLYDYNYASYEEGKGFLIFEYVNYIQYYGGTQEATVHVQMNLTYVSASINEQSKNLYTMIKFESNLVGEDLLIGVSDDENLVYSVYDRYLDSSFSSELRLGHLVMMTNQGHYISDLFSQDYYNRDVNQYLMNVSLSFLDGWSYVDFDGVNWGDIYKNDTMNEEDIIENYKVAKAGTDLWTGQYLGNIEGVLFTESVIDEMLNFGDNLVLRPKDSLKNLLLTSLQDYDLSEIGLEDFYFYDLIEFFKEKQVEFERMSDFYLE